jgi:oligopeptidase B
MPTPPCAPRRPYVLVAHGDKREDDWSWLRDRDDPETIEYLRAENAYTAEMLAPLKGFQTTLFEQIRTRIKESDTAAPARKGPWWYYSRTVEGQQYAIHCRRPDPGRELTAIEVFEAAERGVPGEQILLDENQAAGDSDYFALGVFDISMDHNLLAYAIDLTGSERYALRVRDLSTGQDLEDEISDVYYSSAWTADNRHLFYVRPDAAVRPWQVWRHEIGRSPSEDQLVLQEDDERFFVSVGLTRSEQFVIFSTESKMTSEVRFLAADDPGGQTQVVEPRRQGVEYGVEHARHPQRRDLWLILTNDNGAENFALYEAPVNAPGKSNWRPVLPHRPEVRLDDVDAFTGYFVVSERERGLERLRVIGWSDDSGQLGSEQVIEQPEPVYSLGGAANPEFDALTYRFGYTSLVTPSSTIEYEPSTGNRVVIKQQAVLGDYDPSLYTTERLWAPAPDGVMVPISLVHRRDVELDRSAPCLLYGYGAYEVTIDPTFSSLRLNLLERGFVFAIAHVRGGGELGRKWYEDGKLLRKRNTFTDFIACAEHLISLGYTSSDRLVIRGGSAGGLLMGAVTNMRTELWTAVVAEVPFVDCLTTMQDESLPLTVTEWEEWGNPAADPEVYFYMKSYSPYDNVEVKDYPVMYVTAGLNDPRVGYWEPAKWVAKLRAERTDDRLMVLKTELDAGHGGPSGRYEAWKDEAQVQSFILSAVGITS